MGVPDYSVAKWLLHNLYFAFFLVVGHLIYRCDRQRFLTLGLGIIVRGLPNALNHIVFTAIFLELSPGIFTRFVFLLFAVLAWNRVREQGKLSWRLGLSSIVFGLLYWAVPIVLFIGVDRALGIWGASPG